MGTGVHRANRLGAVTEPITTSELPPPTGARAPAPSATITAVTPSPTDEEVAAIMAATDALWPKPVVAVPAERPRNRAWRFSGRWWATPLPVRRDRPWR